MGKKYDKFLDMMDLKNHTERLYNSLKVTFGYIEESHEHFMSKYTQEVRVF